MKKFILFFIALMFVATISNAQTIPNEGFENWSNPNGYNVPDGWATLNDMTAPMSVYTCTKGTPGNPGASYLKLTSKTVTGIGVVPGIAISGTINTTTLTPKSGFAYAARPTAFTGKWQYMGATTSDIGSIKVYLTHWDAVMGMRDTVGIASKSLTGMVMSWATFSIPFTYNNANTPDTCLIILNASGSTPQNNSYLYVDNLAFTGVSGIDKAQEMGTFSVYPNPAQEVLHLNTSTLTAKINKIEMIDNVGRVVKTLNEATSISIADLPTGMYHIRLYTSKGNINRSFIKQ